MNVKPLRISCISVLLYALNFWHSHQAACLWVEAILNSGSCRCWGGTYPSEMTSPERRVKANPNKQRLDCVLEIPLCLSALPRPNSPRAKTTPVVLYGSSWVTFPLPKKSEFVCQSSDEITGEASILPEGSWSLDGASVLEGCCRNVPGVVIAPDSDFELQPLSCVTFYSQTQWRKVIRSKHIMNNRNAFQGQTQVKRHKLNTSAWFLCACGTAALLSQKLLNCQISQQSFVWTTAWCAHYTTEHRQGAHTEFEGDAWCLEWILTKPHGKTFRTTCEKLKHTRSGFANVDPNKEELPAVQVVSAKIH